MHGPAPRFAHLGAARIAGAEEEDAGGLRHEMVSEGTVTVSDAAGTLLAVLISYL
jgi:hypothetical protein